MDFFFGSIPVSMWILFSSWNQFQEIKEPLVPGRELGREENPHTYWNGKRKNPSEIGASEGCTFLSLVPGFENVVDGFLFWFHSSKYVDSLLFPVLFLEPLEPSERTPA